MGPALGHDDPWVTSGLAEVLQWEELKSSPMAFGVWPPVSSSSLWLPMCLNPTTPSSCAHLRPGAGGIPGGSPSAPPAPPRCLQRHIRPPLSSGETEGPPPGLLGLPAGALLPRRDSAGNHQKQTPITSPPPCTGNGGSCSNGAQSLRACNAVSRSPQIPQLLLLAEEVLGGGGEWKTMMVGLAPSRIPCQDFSPKLEGELGCCQTRGSTNTLYCNR